MAARFGRATLRLLILLLSLLEIAGSLALLRFRCGSWLEHSDRANWLHRSCNKLLRRLRIDAQYRGLRPARGLVCSNHLSYLDIPVYAAAVPCVFVAKAEVARWPLIGFFARAAGTIFIDRGSRASTEEVARRIMAVLDAGIPVLLFPEGTSTDGSVVLRFHPSLLEPATRLGAEMTAAAVGYHASGGTERQICWYGDASLLPHVLRTLGQAGLAAEVEFFPERDPFTERKMAALGLRERVEAIRRRMLRAIPN